MTDISAKHWPFVESPGEFTTRLAEAHAHAPLLAAVRTVLIEDPPTISQEYLALAKSPAKAKEETAWLIEWPADDNLPARWWHPQGGWMMSAAKAIRFARKEDGEAYAASSIGLIGHPVTEHIFL